MAPNFIVAFCSCKLPQELLLAEGQNRDTLKQTERFCDCSWNHSGTLESWFPRIFSTEAAKGTKVLPAAESYCWTNKEGCKQKSFHHFQQEFSHILTSESFTKLLWRSCIINLPPPHETFSNTQNDVKLQPLYVTSDNLPANRLEWTLNSHFHLTS